MTAAAPNSLPQLAMNQPLVVLIRTEDGAPVLRREPVTRADLSDAVSETWRDDCLRAGHPSEALAEVPVCVVPTLTEGSASRCSGFALDLTLPNGRNTRRAFTISCLRPVAQRAEAALLEAQVLQPGQPYVFELVLDEEAGAAGSACEQSPTFNVSMRGPSLSYLNIPIRSLLERSTPVAILDDDEFPVFYTQEAFKMSESFARRGGDCQPPVETGGVLLGSLAACPDSGEMAAIITDVIEVQDADQTTFSLSYSGQSWRRIQAILTARQAAFPEQASRLLGQTHGHSFRPGTGGVCDECPKRPVCNLTSVFVSGDDRMWHGAVFTRQPWALCHIFGLSARDDHVHQLYGLKDGRLQPRGYHLLPDFSFDL